MHFLMRCSFIYIGILKLLAFALIKIFILGYMKISKRKIFTKDFKIIQFQFMKYLMATSQF